MLEKKGWKSKDGDGGVPFRLARIYDINRRAARAAGQWDRIERTKEDLPYLLYISGPSGRPCLDHADLAGVCLPVDDRWWDTHFPPNGLGCNCSVRQVSLAERDLLMNMGEIQAEGSPNRKRHQIDLSWSHNVGKETWEGICPSCERKANQLCDLLGLVATEKWIKWLVECPVLGEFVRSPPAVNKDLALPIAVLPNMEERLRSSVALRRRRESIDPVLEEIQYNSSVLVLKASTAWKQINSRGKEAFPPTEYRKVQALTRDVEYLRVDELEKAFRLVGFAEHDGVGYPVILDFEKETKRSALVTLFSRGRNKEDWEEWKKKQIGSDHHRG